MGFIESPRDHQAAIQNGWLDEQGLMTVEFGQVKRISPTLPDPNRPIRDVLLEIEQAQAAKESRS